MSPASDDPSIPSSLGTAMLASIAEHSDDFVAIGHMEGPTLWANDAALRFLGRTREELDQGKLSPAQTHTPASARQLREIAAPTAVREGIWRGESVFVRHDGAERIMSQQLVAHRDATGKVAYFSAVARDITDKIRIREALERSLASLEEAQALARLGSWEKNLVTGERTWSAEMFRIFGFERSTPPPAQEAFIARIHPDEQHLYPESFARLIDEGSSELTHRILLPGGEVRVVHTRGVTLRSAAGQIIGLRGTAQDITESKAVERQLIEAREAALASAQAKSQFLANMSHEIRTPLNGVLGMTALALDTELTAEQRDYLSTAHASGRELLGLIDGILDLSKIEAGRIELETIPFDLRDVIESAGRLLSEQASERGLELVLRLDAELPSRVQGDPGRLRQVVLNLLGNAIKFTSRGSVSLWARRREGDRVQIEVRDTGPGIAPGKLRSIFEPFTQGDGSTTRKYGGTGLGLTISRQLVEKMGGSLEVDSQLGAGSTFRFTVPLPRVRAGRQALLGRSILVVEPHGPSWAAIEQALLAAGAAPSIAWSAAEAHERLERLREAGTPPTVVLLAHRPPEQDALALAMSLHPALAGAPILVQTSLRQRPSAAALAAAQVSRLLLRPTPLREIIESSLERPDAVSGPRPVPPPVLVVEDNPISAKLATRLLEKLGHAPRTVAGGEEALALLLTGAYPLAFVDLQLPGLGGLDLARQVRAHESTTGHHTVLVALTAGSVDTPAEQCLAAGLDAYLEKPVTMATLRATLSALSR